MSDGGNANDEPHDGRDDGHAQHDAKHVTDDGYDEPHSRGHDDEHASPSGRVSSRTTYGRNANGHAHDGRM